MEPKWATEDHHRKIARHMRDQQWEFLEQVSQHDPLYVCWWDKAGRYTKSPSIPPDLRVFGLITSMEIGCWLKTHPDWVRIGEQSEERYATPVWITDTGRTSLANRALYDMEPVQWGMVEPGWQTIPFPPGAPLEDAGG